MRHEAEAERATEAMTAEAQRQIGLQYDTGSAQDLKTLGMIAASIAGAAFIASAEHQWRSVLGVPVWVVPLLLLVLAEGLFVMSIWQEAFQRGPDVPDLYRTFSGTMIEMKARILRELVEAIEHNRALLPPKQRWYAAGMWSLFLSVITAALALLAGVR